MKKILIILIALILSLPSISQDEVTRNIVQSKNVLKVNTLSMLIGTGSIFYERKLSDMTSGQLGMSLMSYRFGDVKFGGVILTPEYRIYPKREAISGFYLAPYLRYMNFSVKDVPDNTKATLNSIGGGFLLGRQWITNSGFTMDLFFGMHYSSSSLTGDSSGKDINTNSLTGFKPRIGFALGFAF